jgi:predicted kinase
MNNTYEIKTIWICKGIPGSGKSTWALEQLMKYPGKYKRVNRDSFRAMLDGDTHDWDNEKFIVDLRDTIVERSLRKGFDVIVDDTNLKSTNWTELCAIAKRVGNVRVTEKYFPIELKEALERNSKRPKPVPDNVIENFFNKYIRGKSVEVRDEFFSKESPIYNPPDLNKPPAIICDLDGTVAINVGRDYFDMTQVINDAPNEPICTLVRLLSKTYKVLFVSGRDESCREDTDLWLQAHDLPKEALYMREVGDNRKDRVIKEEIYKNQIELVYDVRYVLDDRRQTVDKWRDLNLCCLQVAPGDF